MNESIRSDSIGADATSLVEAAHRIRAPRLLPVHPTRRAQLRAPELQSSRLHLSLLVSPPKTQPTAVLTPSESVPHLTSVYRLYSSVLLRGASCRCRAPAGWATASAWSARCHATTRAHYAARREHARNRKPTHALAVVVVRLQRKLVHSLAQGWIAPLLLELARGKCVS